jgi:small subunit ribosomal protein S21
MIIVKLKDGEKIDSALKKYKTKHNKAKIVKELRDRQYFVKKSVRKRDESKKAIYIQKIKDSERDGI